jgi:hypothetical protein
MIYLFNNLFQIEFIILILKVQSSMCNYEIVILLPFLSLG